MKPVQKVILCVVRGVLLLLLFPARTFAAPRLYLDPATATVAAGSMTTVKLTIDTSGQTATAADAKITFPKALLESSTITTGTFFDSISKVVNALSGTIEIHGYFSAGSSIQSQSGKGVIATLTFKGLAPGAAALTLPCTTATTTDANIVDATGKDVIDCTSVLGSTMTVTQATGGSSLTPTPTPSQLPTAGVETPTIAFLIIGGILFGTGFFMTRKAIL